MNKKNRFFEAVLAAAASLAIVGISLAESKPLGPKAETSYTLNFSNSENRFSAASSLSSQDVLTAAGNPISFAYANLSHGASDWGTIDWADIFIIAKRSMA